MKAHFFCDGCGAAVAARADRCPACGKTFGAVRCPRCGYEGRASEFTRGCKVCGYLAPDQGEGAPRAARKDRLSPAAARIVGASLLGLLILLVVLILARG